MSAFRILTAIAMLGTVCDQGAPGRSGAWPVYCVSAPNYLISKGNASYSLTPGTIAGNGVYSSSQTLSGSIAGAACGIATPAGFSSPNLLASCVAGSGTVTIYIVNTTAGSLVAPTGTYTVVVF